MKRALQIILAISLFGVAFSGVLSYRELFGQSAAVCPSPGGPGTVLGYPACVYGFFMYLVVAGATVAGLVAGRHARIGRDRAGSSGEIGGAPGRVEPETT